MENRDKDHLLNQFLTSVRVFRDKPFIFEKHHKMFVNILRKEAAAEINSLARALHAMGMKPDSRIAFCGLKPSRAFWSCEWAAISIRAGGVIIPADFPFSERVAVLLETRSKVAIVTTAEESKQLFAMASNLPELTHIVCLEQKAGTPTPKPVSSIPYIHAKKEVAQLDFAAFLLSGKKQPDRTAEVLSTVNPADTALLFYKQDEGGLHKAVRYSLAELQAHAQVIERLLGASHAIMETDIVLAAASWDHRVAHIASCYLPILRDAGIQINADAQDYTCFENHPNILVAETAYINALKTHIENHIKKSGLLEWKMFQKALVYGKQKYEAEKIGLQRKLFDYVLNATVIKKVCALLGGRMRLIIGIDDAASYETQLFFHTFGVELVEVPSEIFTGD